ncbi:MAG TPA: hypothetical protein VFM55_08235 [Micromonosporaceae bacterium]|nr:hypothetical protein [Micromonosporaceae bacterium]
MTAPLNLAGPTPGAARPPSLDLDYGALLAGWATLLGCAVVVLAAVGLVAWAVNRRAAATPRLAPGEYARLLAHARELSRLAAAAVATSARAQVAAESARAGYAQAQQAREAAWLAHDRAQQAHAAARRETADLPPPEATASPLTQDVSRAALAAFRRGDLSVEELREVWRRAGGWDAAREQADHELMQARAEEHRTQRAYRLAAAAERAARRDADVAEVAARALTEEAATAVEEAQAARALAAAHRRRARWRRLA